MKIMLLFLIIIVSFFNISSQSITLEKIDINASEIWCLNRENSIEIVALDKNNSLINLTTIQTFYNIPNLTKSEFFLENQTYKSYFFINSTKEQKYNITIEVNQEGKILNETIQIQTVRCGGFFNNFKNIFVELDTYFSKNWHWCIFGFLILLALYILFSKD